MSTTLNRNDTLLKTTILFAICVWGVGFFLEHVWGLIPCTLCLFERSAFLFIAGFLFLAMLIDSPKIVRGLFLLCANFVSLAGLLSSGYHIWLQKFKHDSVSCGPSLEYLMQQYSVTRSLYLFFQAPGECAKVDTVFLYLPLSFWAFIFLAICSVCCWKLLFNNWSAHGPK